MPIMMWQSIDILCRRALEKYNGKLPTMVNFIFDEFANIGTIPDIEQTIAVTRSRNIGISIILQSVAQLESRYDKKAKTIIDCCDTTLFLGGKEKSTLKELHQQGNLRDDRQADDQSEDIRRDARTVRFKLEKHSDPRS